jgi:CBS-domain-containing membrane protein
MYVCVRVQTGCGCRLLTCKTSDTLARALTLFATGDGIVERLVCVDDERRVTGIVSLSDVFAFFCRGMEVSSAAILRTASDQQFASLDG